MKQFRVVVLALLAACAVAAASPATHDLRAETAVRDSLSRVHPRMRARWLRERGLDDSPYTTFRKPDSGSGLRCIGRWPWGPSWELCGRDSLLFLGSGSGVRILSVSDSIHPRQLGQIVARGLVTQLVIRDTLLFVACGSWGAQIYSVSDPANPVELGSMGAVIYDLAVIDTFCYTLGVPSGSSGTDSFRIYSLTDPVQPRRLGAVRDSGHTLAVIDGHAYSAGRWTLNVYDVTNPAAPQWVSSLGGSSLALCARGNLLFRSGVSPSYFSVYDITDPLNISQVGQLSGYGGWALWVDSSYAYLACVQDRSGLYLIDITNPASPQPRGNVEPEGTESYDSYAFQPRSYGYLASDFGGLVVLDLHDANAPTELASGFKADASVDIDVTPPLAVIAYYFSGVQFIDVANPATPVGLGQFDTVGTRSTATAVLSDSFAFISMSGIPGRRYMRTLDITDPVNPALVAQESCRNPPEDMVLRDSLLYCAEVNQFQIFNVARPRAPVLVGSCASTDGVNFGLVVQDTLAYLVGDVFQVISVGRPDAPVVLSTTQAGTSGLAVRDTFAYLPDGWDSVHVYSVANPVSPYLVSAVPCGVWPWDVALGESRMYVAASDGWGIDVYDLADPAHPVRRGRAGAPTDIRRLCYHDGHVYAALWDAGVAVYETTAVGISEEQPAGEARAAVGMRGSVVRDELVIELPAAGGGDAVLSAYDMSGRCVEVRMLRGQGREVRYSFARLPAGVYVLRVRCAGQTQSFKVVKL